MNQIVSWKHKRAPVDVGAAARRALIRLREGRRMKPKAFDTAPRRLANRLAYLLVACWLTARYGRAGRLEWRSNYHDLASKDLFLKPELGRGARGARWFRNLGPARYRSSNGTVVSLDDILDLVVRRSRFQGQILQELLNNHPSIA